MNWATANYEMQRDGARKARVRRKAWPKGDHIAWVRAGYAFIVGYFEGGKYTVYYPTPADRAAEDWEVLPSADAPDPGTPTKRN